MYRRSRCSFANASPAQSRSPQQQGRSNAMRESNARVTQAALAAAHTVLEMRYGGPVMTPDPAIARVLVVDDNAENRALAKAALEDEDVPVVLAATGAEAIAA